MIEEWICGASEPSELHITSTTFHSIKLPALQEQGLAILEKSINVLCKSHAYPYGLTQNIIERLLAAEILTVGQLANKTDQELDSIDYIGTVKIKMIRDVVYQAIWM